MQSESHTDRFQSERGIGHDGQVVSLDRYWLPDLFVASGSGNGQFGSSNTTCRNLLMGERQ